MSAAPSPRDPASDQQRYRALVESLDGVVWELDPGTGNLTFVSPRTNALLGYGPDEWTSNPHLWRDVLHPDDAAMVTGHYRDLVKDGGAERFEYRVRARDGRVLWFSDQVNVVRDDDRAAVVVRGLTVDVTEAKLAALRQAAQHTTMTILADATSLSDAGPVILEQLCTILDWEVGGFWEVAATGELRRVFRHSRRPVPNFDEASDRIALRVGVGLPGRVAASGEPAWIHDVTVDPNFPRAPTAAADGLHGGFAFPVKLGGRVLAVLEFLSSEAREPDAELLTAMATIGGQIGQFVERTRAEAELRFQHAMLSSQNEATLDGTLLIGDDGRILSFNQRLVEISGIPREILESGTARALMEWAAANLEDRDQARQHAALVQTQSDATDRERITLKDGRVFDRYTAPLIGADGTRYGRAWYFRDVSAETRREATLRKTTERLGHLARTLQESLLPPHLPVIAGAAVAARYRPATSGLEVGGDFYDVFETGRHDWAFVMGDVCGKGAEAAAITALARYTVRAAAIRARRPSRILAVLNEALLQQRNDTRFCTIAYARLRFLKDRTRLTVCAGGHPLPMLVRADGGIEQVGVPGTLLGVFADPLLRDVSVDLGPGDTLVLYTDGVTDARRDGEVFGIDRVRETITSVAGESPQEIVRAVGESVDQFAEGQSRDDVALLAFTLLTEGRS